MFTLVHRFLLFPLRKCLLLKNLLATDLEHRTEGAMVSRQEQPDAERRLRFFVASEAEFGSPCAALILLSFVVNFRNQGYQK